MFPTKELETLFNITWAIGARTSEASFLKTWIVFTKEESLRLTDCFMSGIFPSQILSTTVSEDNLVLVALDVISTKVYI